MLKVDGRGVKGADDGSAVVGGEMKRVAAGEGAQRRSDAKAARDDVKGRCEGDESECEDGRYRAIAQE